MRTISPTDVKKTGKFMKRLTVVGLSFVLAFGNIQAQQTPVTFTSNTTLVIIDVSIKDKSGKVIEDLKKGDFALTEDGKTQQIAVFDFQKLDIDSAPPVPAVKPAAEVKPATAAGQTAATISGAIVQTAQPTPSAPKAPAPAQVATKPGTARAASSMASASGPSNSPSLALCTDGSMEGGVLALAISASMAS